MANHASISPLPAHLTVPSSTTVDSHQAAVLSWIREIAPYGILTTDADLRIRSWNEWLESHSGLAAPLVIGKPLLELFPTLSERKLEGQYHRALSGEVIVLSSAFHEYLLPMPPTVRDSGFQYMQQTARIAPLSLHGQLCGTITIIEDVTQREAQVALLAHRHEKDRLLSSCLAHLLRSQELENVVYELLPQVTKFLRVDTFANYLFIPETQSLRLNASFGLNDGQKAMAMELKMGESISGLAVSERRMISFNNIQASTHPNASVAKSMGLRAAAGQPLLVGDRLIGAISFGTREREVFSPEELDFIATLSQYVAVALDRTLTQNALQKARQALLEHAANLETKVHERTAALQDTVAQLESFSYSVAHDLRAPIRALQGYAELLLKAPESTIQEKGVEYLHRIERAANRLDALTRDLLQFSSISRQDAPLVIVNPTDILSDLQLLRLEIPNGVLTIKEPLHAVWAHPTLLQQCLSNLLDNALKFVVPGTTPSVTVWSEKFTPSQPEKPETGSRHAFHSALLPLEQSTSTVNAREPAGSQSAARRIRIYVEDNGIGIEPECRQKVFGVFERLHVAGKYEGTGIGLAIVARAIQRMNGSCGVEAASSGNGSRFWLELACAE